MQKCKPVFALMLAASPLFAGAYECNFTQLKGPGFGSLAQGSNLTADGNIEVSCDPAANPANLLPANGMVTITVSAAPGGSGSYFPYRQMGGPDGPMYNLYTNPARTSSGVWGDGTSGTMVFSHTFTFTPMVTGLPPMVNFGQPQSHIFQLYGAVSAGLNVRARGYSDTLTTTLTY